METIQFIGTSPNALAELIDEKIRIQLIDLKKDLKFENPDEFLTRKETSEFLKISLVCLHDWVNKGILKSYKLGNKTYFNREEVIQTLFNSNK